MRSNAANVVPVARSTQPDVHVLYMHERPKSRAYAWNADSVLRATGTTLAAFNSTGCRYGPIIVIDNIPLVAIGDGSM